MKKKIIIVIGIIIVILIGIISIYFISKPKDIIGKEKTVQGIKFSNAKIYKEGVTYYFYVVVTTTKESIKAEDFDATIYDKKGNILSTVTGYIGDIDKNSKKEITIESLEDVSKAYEVNYTIRVKND